MAKPKQKAEPKAGPLLCPFCLDQEGDLEVRVNGPSEVKCLNCDESFSPVEAVKRLDAVIAQAARWRAVAEWIAKAPVVEGEAS